MSSLIGYVCWEWRRDDGGYCPYTPVASNELETAWNARKKQCTVGNYVVDLQNMKQCRQASGEPVFLLNQIHNTGVCGCFSSQC